MAELEPNKRYRCSGCGLRSTWTGAYTRRSPVDDLCSACGALMAEVVSNGRWRVSWSYHGTVTSREHDDEVDARSQVTGLLALAEGGEAITDVKLERSDTPVWTEVPVDVE